MPGVSISPDYIARVRQLIGNYSRRSSVSPLGGSFKSVYRGKSMDFDDLREYVYGDDVSDIDWKSSMRTGTLLVKRFIAEKRHSALIACDTGRKMDADAAAGQPKRDLLVETAGVIAFIVAGHGDDLAFIHQGRSGLSFAGFKNGESHMMQGLAKLGRSAFEDGPGAAALLDHIGSRMGRRMVVFLITDMDGIASITERELRRATVRNDLMIFDIDDAYLFGSDAYDVDSGKYFRRLGRSDDKLAAEEAAEREARLSAFNDLCLSNGVVFQVISHSDDIVPAVYAAMTRNRG